MPEDENKNEEQREKGKEEEIETQQPSSTLQQEIEAKLRKGLKKAGPIEKAPQEKTFFETEMAGRRTSLETEISNDGEDDPFGGDDGKGEVPPNLDKQKNHTQNTPTTLPNAEQQPSKGQSANRDKLLAQIQGGITLKPVGTREQKKPVNVQKQEPAAQSLDLAQILGDKIKVKNIKEEETSEISDDEWDAPESPSLAQNWKPAVQLPTEKKETSTPVLPAKSRGKEEALEESRPPVQQPSAQQKSPVSHSQKTVTVSQQAPKQQQVPKQQQEVIKIEQKKPVSTGTRPSSRSLPPTPQQKPNLQKLVTSEGASKEQAKPAPQKPQEPQVVNHKPGLKQEVTRVTENLKGAMAPKPEVNSVKGKAQFFQDLINKQSKQQEEEKNKGKPGPRIC